MKRTSKHEQAVATYPHESLLFRNHTTHTNIITQLYISCNITSWYQTASSLLDPPPLSFKFQFNSRNYFSKDVEYRITSNPILWGKQEARLSSWLIYWVIKLYDDFIQLKSPVWKRTGKHNQFGVASFFWEQSMMLSDYSNAPMNFVNTIDLKTRTLNECK